MSDIASHLESEVLNWCFQATDMATAPGTLYVALHTADPGSDGTSSELDSSSGASGYSRYEASAPGEFTAPSGSDPTSVSNDGDFVFNEATGDWPTVTHVSIWDTADSTGNALWKGDLDNSRDVVSGDQFVLRSGSLTVDLD